MAGRLLLAPFVCLLAQAAGCAAVQVSVVTHRKIDNCVEVKAGTTRLVVVPAWAGRISVLDFGAGNVLWSDPKLDGRLVKPAEGWAPWDGNATDILRSDGKSQWKGLWIHPWPKVRRLPDGVEVESEVSPETQLSARRTYRLSPDGTRLSYSFTITCHGGTAAGWTIWERALLPPDGYVVAPIAREGAFPEGWKLREGASVEPADRVTRLGDFLVLRAGTVKGTGLAARLRAGWAAHVVGNHALLDVFPLSKDGRYPHQGGAQAFFWVDKDKLELEPLSSEAVLSPGQSLTFTELWHWLELPAGVEPSDPEAAGRWLDGRAAGLIP